jgi:hypothetical protein
MENWGDTHIRSFYTRNLFNYVPPVFARRIHVCNFCDYEKLRQNLFNVNWDSLFLTDDIELITNDITNAILSAAESSIPSKIVTIRKGGPKWLSCIYETYYRTMISYLFGECRSYSSVYQPINIICQYKIN